ncbi:hypothetical protein LARV_03920 [Longilinea arvoryzae]|uniref:Uncharacterized protein n=1 Tax=Longilinea arvoryzae TaxID=360412 RepID=A0A0K8MXY9_9CHLR|nr:hypothetical protein [Longilinea arvoryzae]GAP16124.1 hypothetical protein LARV_03920 [Longilinea arvoryzae]
MNTTNSNFGTPDFQDADRESGHIIAEWLRRCGVERKTILEEMNDFGESIGEIGEKSFKQWTSDGESARRVSGATPELRGDRLIALVRWFVHEHAHRSRPVMNTTELRRLMGLYEDLPVKNRLQFRRILHDLEVQSGEREADFSFANDWKGRLADWPVFCFVLDPYWTIRASTSYEMALAGYSEEDMKHWGWWHRLTGSSQGTPKYVTNSPRYSLRGPYAEVYYRQQLERFCAATEPLQKEGDPRYQALLKLLDSTPRFHELWMASQKQSPTVSQSIGIPVPFFRQDGTLLWMLEVSTMIPNTPDYTLIVWVPLNEDAAEYQGEIRRKADQSGRFSRKAFFIEEFSQYFTPEQRFALGVE